ncbi:hypothetical protein EJB05_49593 [Eragrostis curvula]|uniref:Uncharacterized protein n=1 Tax=Eragrostis curvula TaxID=38414 RepID=A0A5J9T764_9POAL|nr:hypothetical protein EJB05_49593 [Eragrostis curvula]
MQEKVMEHFTDVGDKKMSKCIAIALNVLALGATPQSPQRQRSNSCGGSVLSVTLLLSVDMVDAEPPTLLMSDDTASAAIEGNHAHRAALGAPAACR